MYVVNEKECIHANVKSTCKSEVRRSDVITIVCVLTINLHILTFGPSSLGDT